MTRHSFDPQVAQEVGINAAVVFQNIVWWCEKNAANEHNIHDGRAWTYNSQKAFEALFPYLSGKQIRTALDKLEEVGLVVVGNFNKDARDRTKWYAVGGRCNCPEGQMQMPQRADTFAPEGGPLPVSKPDITNTPIPPEGAIDLFSASGQPTPENGDGAEAKKPDSIEESFERFWKAYPKKAGKPNALKAWKAAIKHADPDRIISGAERYAEWLSSAAPGEFRPQPKYPQGWLNDHRWTEFEDSANGEPREEDLSRHQHAMLRDGRVPPSMADDNGQPNAAARYWLKKFGYGRAA